MGMWDLLKMLTSLVLVFGLMGLLLWLLRRMQQRLQIEGTAGRRIRLLDSMSVGARQKIVLIEVDNQRLVVGITPQHMSSLGQWPAAATPPSTESSSHVQA